MASKVRCRLGDRAKIASEHWANRIHGKRVLEKAKRKFSSGASAWAKKVMARGEMTCQDCGTIEGEHHAHHIVQVSVAPDLVSEIDNGVRCAPGAIGSGTVPKLTRKRSGRCARPRKHRKRKT